MNPNFLQQELIFGSLPPSEFEDEFLRLTQFDLAEAQKHLAELPVEDRRGLTLATLRQFRCGYLPDWVNTKSRAEFVCGKYINELTREPKHLPPASPRIIIPTYSMKHFNAVTPPSYRRRFPNDKWPKQHVRPKELFFTPGALLAKTIIVVEGEFCAMSIWQATGGKVPVVAILGCNNADKTLFPILSSLPERRFILLLDGDAAGQKAAKKLEAKLDGRGVPNVTKFLYEYMSKAIRNEFGPGHARTDANDLLKSSYGEKYLADIIAKILKESEPQLQAAADRIAERNRQLREDNARADAQKLNLNVRPFEPPEKHAATHSSDTVENFDAAKYSSDPDEARRILSECLTIIHARDCDRDDWFKVGCVMKRYGLTLDDFLSWSNDGDPRYKADDCRIQWQSMKSDAELGNGGIKIGTVIQMAQNFKPEYKPARRTVATGINLAAAGYDDVQAAESQNEADEADNSRHSALFEWQKINGTIDPGVVPDIIAATKYLQSLTAKDITSEKVHRSTTIESAALCKVYGFEYLFDAFIAEIIAAQGNAKAEISKIRNDGEQPPAELRTLIKVSISGIRSDVERAANRHIKRRMDYLRDVANKKRWDEKQLRRKISAYALTPQQVEYLFSLGDTDLYNALRLEYLFENEIRFLETDDRWLTFAPKRGTWKKAPSGNSAILPFAEHMALSLDQNEPPPSSTCGCDPQELIESWQSNYKVVAAINLLKGIERIRITAADLDKHSELLNCKNGVVNLSTGEFYPTVDPKLLITQQCNAEYRQGACDATVERFLRDILPDEETRAALIRWLGYCLTASTIEEKALFIWGRGGNGKGTLTKLLIMLLGDYAASVPVNAVIEAGRFKDAGAATPELSCLEKCRLGVVEELPQGGRLDVEKFKMLTGSDKIPVRRLYEEYRTVEATHKLILSGNHRPTLNDTRDDGLLRRLLNINFCADFTKNPDQHLKEKLTTPDALAAMLALLVDAAKSWYRDGLIISAEMKEATRCYLAENDFIADFISEFCTRAADASIDRKSFLNKLRAEYSSECSRLTDRALNEAAARVDGISYRRTTGGERRFFGIEWNHKDEQSFDGEPVPPDDVPDLR